MVVWCRAVRTEKARAHHRLDRLYSFLDQAAFRGTEPGAHLSLPLRPPPRRALVLTRQLTRSTSFSLTWVYGTGNAATLPVARYYNDDAVRGGTPRPYYLPYETVVYGDRNGYRMSAFHHLDFSFNFGQAESAGHGFSFGVYNAYNHKNPFFIYFEDHYDSAARRQKVPR